MRFYIVWGLIFATLTVLFFLVDLVWRETDERDEDPKAR